MRKQTLILILTIIPVSLFSQGLGKIYKGTSERISFHRVSIVIPKDWNYSSNPRARAGTDQLQLYSDDRNRTIQITLTKERDDLPLVRAVQMGGQSLAGRLCRIPEFQGSTVVGSGGPNEMWGRTGTSVELFIIKEGQTKDNPAMHIYSYGERVPAKREVLFIVYFVAEEEKEDAINVIKSLEILK